MSRYRFSLSCASLLTVVTITLTNCSPANQESRQGLDRRAHSIWQLDYFPDSILVGRSIYKYSNWSVPYAYNINFTVDSCEFIGLEQRWWNELTALNDSTYQTPKNEYNQFWIVTLGKHDRFWLREVFKDDTSEYYPYHPVDSMFELSSLGKRIAKEVFVGNYRVIYKDSVECSDTIRLMKDFTVQGLNGMTEFVVPIDEQPYHSAVDDGLAFRGSSSTRGYAFRFSGDTLQLRDKNVVGGEYDIGTYAIGELRLTLIKLPE